MDFSWISNRSLKLSPRARLVDDSEAEALRRKRESLSWTPENGFLKDRWVDRQDRRRRGTQAA